MNHIQEIIIKAIDGKRQEIPQEARESLIEVFSKIYEKGESPREAMGIAGQLVDFSYQHAVSLYQNGKFIEAIPILTWLHTLEPQSFRFAYSLAASYHNIGDYERALGHYMYCGGLEADNPEPSFYIADCLELLGISKGAVELLEATISKAGGKPEYAQIKELASLSLKRLQNEQTFLSQREEK